MTDLDRINSLSLVYVQFLNDKVSLPGVEIEFTGFKPAQGSVFILGQLLAWPEGIITPKKGSKFQSTTAEMTLYYAHVPDRGIGKFTRDSTFEIIVPPDVPHFTGREAAWELQEVLQERFDALVAFIRANPAEWMTTKD